MRVRFSTVLAQFIPLIHSHFIRMLMMIWMYAFIVADTKFFCMHLFWLVFILSYFFFHFGLLNHRRSQVEIIVSIIFFSFVFVRSIVVFATLLLMMLSINLFMQFVSNESHGRRSCMKFHERQTFAATMSTDDA